MKPIVFSTLLVLILVGNAIGDWDTGPNAIGVYFDEWGQSTSTVSDGSSLVHAYLLLTNPTESGDLVFWSIYVWAEDQWSGSVIVRGEPRFGNNEIYPMPGETGAMFFVTNDIPMPPTFELIMILADLTINLHGYLQPVGIRLSASVYSLSEFVGWGADNLIEMNPSSGSTELPAAMINGPAPVGVEGRSWDSLKVLFRD